MQRSGRYDELDALRGLAALVVFVYHCILLFALCPAWLGWVVKTPLGLVLYGGHQAVILFFVLSGFVLYLPYERGGKTASYLAFVLKRVCRIYLPYLVALAFFVLAYAVFFKTPQPAGLSYLYGWRVLSLPAAAALLRDHILFLGFFHREYWNGATWTLTEEMRISLIFPLLARLVRRRKPWISLGLALGCSAAVSVAVRMLHHRTPFEPFHYASLFVLGAVLASKRVWLIECWHRSETRRRAIVVGTAVLVSAYAVPLGVRFPRVVTEELSDWLIAASVSVFLVAALSDTWFSRFLRFPSMVHLGRTSYGIYLLHLPVLFVFVNLLWGRVSALLVFALSLAVTLALAHIFYAYCERPSMALGKRLTHAIDRPSEGRVTSPSENEREPAGGNTRLEPSGVA